MNPHLLTLLTLVAALIGQAIAAGLATEIFLRKGLPGGLRRAWIALALGGALLTLHHGYTLELALRTGLYDLRQAVLAALVALLFALGTDGLRRQTA